MNDPLVDWLKHNSKKSGNFAGSVRTIFPKYKKDDSFKDYIMNQGVVFEESLIKYINNNVLPVVSVSTNCDSDGFAKTIELMKKGVPVIHSAPLKGSDNTGGVADLLVRSDYLKKLVRECPLTDVEQLLPSSKLGVDYHYVVIDVKFSTLPLRADGKLLLNSGGYPAYKAQAWIYTKAVGDIQGYTSQYAYIMGRRWKYTSKDVNYQNYTCLDKLGVIDFDGVDKSVIATTKKAVKWVRDVEQNSASWTVDPPSRVELYPNMCVDSGKWNLEKEQISDKIGEITSIWYCGVKNRNNCLSQGVTSWKDENCTSKVLGMNGIRSSTIDSILDINRQNVEKIRPKIIKTNLFDWKTSDNELYVDFETITDMFSKFDNIPNQPPMGMIFMIGVGWADNGVWKHTNFTAKTNTVEEEYRIMDEFMKFVRERNQPKLFYWYADKSFWNSAEQRQFEYAEANNLHKISKRISKKWQVREWADLLKIFTTEPIVLKDCFKFGLKNIASSMKKHNFITTSIDSNCSNGMDAQIQAYRSYTSDVDPSSSSVMNDIKIYNEFDCKVLYDILTYLRKNHV